MSKASHMGKERIYLARISVLEEQKKQLEQEVFCIMDRLVNADPKFQEKRNEITEIIIKIHELEAMVEYHIDAQTKGEKERGIRN